MRWGPPASRLLRLKLLVRALLGVAIVELTIRHLSVDTLCRRAGVRFLAFEPPPTTGGTLPWDVAHRWWAVEVVLARWPWGAARPCMRRSLVLGRMLRWHQPALALEIATMDPFEAHAFLIVRDIRLEMGSTGPWAMNAAGPRV